ncbi:MAG TPA: IS66 family transposase [Terracidiphilus sp.]|nr:IS66 family transposase [Terracidiphilus sp.]
MDAPLPDNLAAAHAMILAERAARIAVEAQAKEAALLRLEIERLKLQLAKARRQQWGQSAERGSKIEQLELQLEELEVAVAVAEAREEAAATESVAVKGLTRAKPARRPLPDHLPRKRIVYPAPSACPCCGGTALSKLGEDITETLERVPAQWFVIQHVREKMSCRACETISQQPAPFHPIVRGRAGPHLLADVAFSKFGLHLPLHRQSERFARESVPVEVSTLAGWIGAVAVALEPLIAAINAHVLAAARIHADDTPVPVLAKHKTRTGRLWTVVRDDRPFSGPDPPAASFFYSTDRKGEHAERFLKGFKGIMQADAYSGFGRLYDQAREGGPILEAACWSHARRNFFELAELSRAPIAVEAVKRIDALFTIEREVNGQDNEARLAARRERSQPLVDDLEAWLKANRAMLSPRSNTAVAIDYMLKRWVAFTRFLKDGRVCMSNNAAERSLRCVAVGRKNWTFAGSDEGGHRAASIYAVIETCKLNEVDPHAWLADVLARLPEHPVHRINELLPWNWRKPTLDAAAA